MSHNIKSEKEINLDLRRELEIEKEILNQKLEEFASQNQTLKTNL